MAFAQLENNCFTETCSGSKAGLYLRLIDCVYHSTLGLRVMKKRRRVCNPTGSKVTGQSPGWEATREHTINESHVPRVIYKQVYNAQKNQGDESG